MPLLIPYSNFLLVHEAISCYTVLQGVICMPHVSLRVSEKEKNWMESYAKLHGLNLSDAIKMAFFEKLEDEYDLKTIRDYEKEKPGKFYSLKEVSKELGLEDEL